MARIEKVGIIGLGRMGFPVARHLLAAEFSVYGFDSNPAAAEVARSAGAGQAAKAINNMLLWTCLAANVEGLDFGEALGGDREALREALCHGSGANWALETRADERPALWAEMDMDLLLGEAAAATRAMPVSEAVREAIAAFKKACGLATPSIG